MNDWPLCIMVNDRVWFMVPGSVILHTGPATSLVIGERDNAIVVFRKGGIDAAILPRADIERRRREGLLLHLNAMFERVRRNAERCARWKREYQGERNVSLRN